jgi:hypothetical protein
MISQRLLPVFALAGLHLLAPAAAAAAGHDPAAARAAGGRAAGRSQLRWRYTIQRGRLASLRAQRDESLARLEDPRASLATARETLATARATATTKRNIADRWTRRLDRRAQEAANRAERAVEANEAETTVREQELARLESEVAAHVATLDGKIASQQQRLDETRADLRKLVPRHLRDALTQAKTEVARLQPEVDNLFGIQVRAGASFAQLRLDMIRESDAPASYYDTVEREQRRFLMSPGAVNEAGIALGRARDAAEGRAERQSWKSPAGVGYAAAYRAWDAAARQLAAAKTRLASATGAVDDAVEAIIRGE